MYTFQVQLFEFKVELSSPFIGFDCAPYWRLIPIDGTLESPYAINNGLYIVKQEYDVRFFCTWSQKGIFKNKLSYLKIILNQKRLYLI